ncbi:MAG: outer membrane beta-barrel protein [Gammaproteobacteria bacterium]
MFIHGTSASRFVFTVLAGLLLPFAAGASNFSYTWIEGSYSDVSLDDSDFDGDAYGINAAWQFNEMVYVFGGYEYGDYDFDVESDTFELGVGLAFPVSDMADFVVGASYVDVSVDVPGLGSVDDDGYSVFGGFRLGLSESFQVDAGVSYVDLSDGGDDTSFSITGRYYFTPSWAIGAGYATSDDADAWTLSVRWELPR